VKGKSSNGNNSKYRLDENTENTKLKFNRAPVSNKYRVLNTKT
jgi:hypothetical protein